MKLKLLCCEVLYREACRLISESIHTVEAQFMPKGLHDLGVEKMLVRLQEQIDLADEQGYDALLLGYGLCNNGIAGLRTRKTRMVIPRAHDCITLFMGSRQKYIEYFQAHPGTYYRTSGWYERSDSSGAGEETVFQKLGLWMQYDELVRKYGEENAKYIQETLGDGLQNYDRVTFIGMGMGCDGRFRQMAQQEAQKKNWSFDEVEGSLSLLRRLLFGEWDADFLVLEPGQTPQPSHDEQVIRSEPAKNEPLP